VVAEFAVLLRIQHLEKGRGGVTPKVSPQLVYLVEHKDGIAGASATNGLYNAARHGADVRATMATDLGLIVHPAQGLPNERSPQRTRNRPPQRGLADAGRPNEAQDHPLPFETNTVSLPILRRCVATTLLPQLAHCQELEDALLDALQVVVVLIQHASSGPNIEVVLSDLLPGHLDKPVQIGANDTIFSRRRREGLHAL